MPGEERAILPKAYKGLTSRRRLGQPQVLNVQVCLFKSLLFTLLSQAAISRVPLCLSSPIAPLFLKDTTYMF